MLVPQTLQESNGAHSIKPTGEPMLVSKTLQGSPNAHPIIPVRES